MSDPVCDPARIHYFRQPVFDGEKCQCGVTTYQSEKSYHHAPDDNNPSPFNPMTDIITSPWAPLIESVLLGDSSPSTPDPDFGGFGGGQTGGGGAGGDW